MTPADPRSHDPAADERHRPTFSEDFRRFFFRGLATLMPTLVTIWLLLKVWGFLWEEIGQPIIAGLHWISKTLAGSGAVPTDTATNIRSIWDTLPDWAVHWCGVLLAILLIYILGLFVGNVLGRASWRLLELTVMRIPIVRAVYPAVKQVTDFLLAERKHQFEAGRVVAIEPHSKGIWSIGLVTGPGVDQLNRAVGREMVTVFVPSSPAAFSGYVLVVPRDSVVELPLTVEQAMRLLVSGGVLDPQGASVPMKLTAILEESLPPGSQIRIPGGQASGSGK